MISIASTILLCLHLVAVGVAAGTPLLCIWLRWREKAGDLAAGRMGRALVLLSLVAMLVGSLLGILIGYLMWLDGAERFFAALGRLNSKVNFAVGEAAFFAVTMLLLVVWWKYGCRESNFAAIGQSLIALAASTNLLWHFPPLFAIATHLAATEPHGAPLTSADFRHFLFTGHIFARCIHFWLASLVVSAIAAMPVALLLGNRHNDAAAVRHLVFALARVALLFALLQIPLGMWLLSVMGGVSQSRMMGSDLIATGLLVASVLSAVAMMHQLANLAQGEYSRRAVALCAVLVVAVMSMMTVASLRARGDLWQQPLSWETSRETLFHSAFQD